MIVVLERGSTQEQIDAVLEELERLGLRGRAMRTAEKPLIHVVSSSTRAARSLVKMSAVEGLVRTSGPRVRRQGRRFYPYHFIGWSCAALLLIGALVLLAGFFPPGLGEPVDFHAPAPGAGAPWYLRPVLAFLSLFPERLAWLGRLVLGALLAIVVLLPAIDRTKGDRTAQRWPVLVPLLLVLLGFAYATIRELA